MTAKEYAYDIVSELSFGGKLDNRVTTKTAQKIIERALEDFNDSYEIEDLSINTKEDFVDACISSGKCVQNSLNLTVSQEREVEDAVNKFSDAKARKLINKILKTV